jgi:hypothetical protein
VANIFLAWQNKADEGVLAGGSWNSSLPLSNLQTRQVQKVARTSDDALASTQFTLDLQSAKAIGVVGLIVHNISVDGKVRITAADDLAAWNNIVTASNDITDPVWVQTFANTTANALVAPDGTLTADKLYEDFFLEPHNIEQALGTLSGERFLEAWFYPAERTKGRLMLWGPGGVASAEFDMTTGTLIASSGTAYIRKYSNGWCKVTVSNTFTSGALGAQVALLDNDGVDFYTGDGGSGFYVWGVRSYTGHGMADDSGYVDCWPAGVVPQDLLEWEDDNFWLGTLSQNQRAGFQSPYLYRLPASVSVRYWKVEILDTTNEDGFIQIGRLFMARGWTPSVNYAYGAGLGYNDPSPVATSLSGAEYFDMRSKYREMSFTLEYITDTEAYSYALDLQRLAGISGEVLVMPDGGEDVGQQPLRSFVGRLKQIGKVTQPKPTTFSVQFEVKELL